MFQSVIKVSCALVMTLVSAHALAAGDSEAGQAKAVTCVAFHPSGWQLASGSDDGDAR